MSGNNYRSFSINTVGSTHDFLATFIEIEGEITREDQINQVKNYRTHWGRSVIVLLFIVAAWLLNSGISGGAEPIFQPNSPAERWVIDQTIAGKEADLKVRFPKKEDRVLGALFLEHLFTNAFKDIEVHRHGVRINNAVVAEPLDLENAEIPFEIRLINCIFKDKVILSKSLFHKSLSFRGSSFEMETDFYRMRVDGNAFFDRAIFQRLTDFTYSEIGINLTAQGSNFKKKAIFNGMKVGGSTRLENVIFEGKADFSFTNIGINFLAQGARFQQEADFKRMKVKDEASFNEAAFQSTVHFTFAEIGNKFWVVEVSWPTGPESVWLYGMTYQDINAGTDKKILELVELSVYYPDVYENLEAFYKKRGKPDRADDVFVAKKSRESEELLRKSGWLRNLPAWSWNRLLGLLVRHGRSPHRAFIWSAIILLIGFKVFRHKESMEPQNPEDTSRKYSAFWYSLDLFIPFVNLRSASVWAPRENRRCARHYMRVHTILGWILIPIGLAALTGIIG